MKQKHLASLSLAAKTAPLGADAGADIPTFSSSPLSCVGSLAQEGQHWGCSHARVPEVCLLDAERGLCWGTGTTEHSEVALKPPGGHSGGQEMLTLSGT